MANAINTETELERGRFGLAELASPSSVVMMLPAGCRQLRASSPRSPELQPTRPRLQRTKVGLGKLPRPTGWQPVFPGQNGIQIQKKLDDRAVIARLFRPTFGSGRNAPACPRRWADNCRQACRTFLWPTHDLRPMSTAAPFDLAAR